MPGYDNGSVSVGTVNVPYRVEGSGEKAVVLLHGLNAHAGTWRKTFPVLVEKNYLVLAPSLPPVGSGKVSAELVGRYSRYVEEVCDRVGVRSASVIGSSMGGLGRDAPRLSWDGAGEQAGLGGLGRSTVR